MFTKGGPPSLTANRLRDPAGMPPRPTMSCHDGKTSPIFTSTFFFHFFVFRKSLQKPRRKNHLPPEAEDASFTARASRIDREIIQIVQGKLSSVYHALQVPPIKSCMLYPPHRKMSSPPSALVAVTSMHVTYLHRLLSSDAQQIVKYAAMADSSASIVLAGKNVASHPTPCLCDPRCVDRRKRGCCTVRKPPCTRFEFCIWTVCGAASGSRK